MHLLQLRDGELSLAEFVGSNIPRYAILSHTWGSKEEELTYQDILQKTGKEKQGYHKLIFCGEQAAKDGLEHFWVDTCCIDKTSSAELSEAITSMFRWYQNSAQCYAYLSDVSARKREADHDKFNYTWEPAFRTSRWWSRGWTLQELIAPRTVSFFSKEGTFLGDKSSLGELVDDIAHIPVSGLLDTSLEEYDVDQRMKWLGDRKTTREEDRAYCMLGIVGVSMLPMYGEGEERALRRLRKEIRETSGDTTSTLSDERKKSLLESLRFEQFDARQMTIKSAHAETCKWLLKSREYRDWTALAKLDEHHGFLWIKGKAGTGKSTLMKFALINARKKKGHITISFFFNARGEEMEKSTVGAYRSLLLQLLTPLPALQIQSVFDSAGLSTSSISENYHWTIGPLKMLLEHAFRILGESRKRVICFIDALDEGAEEHVRDMIQFFEGIGRMAVLTKSQLLICLSSRHYPTITIQKGLNLVLEGHEEHSQDIAKYIKTELKIGKSKTANQIRSELQEKASGIFMWVVIVVGILNKQWDRGQVLALQRKLQEIPADLHELFRDILTRDSENKDQLILCIQWVLFAKHPLSPEQLYHAIISGDESEKVSAFDSEMSTKDVLKNFILHFSKGFVETTVSKEPKVQFIHESVKDFLLKENGLGKIWPEFANNFQGRSHEQLKQCCLEYTRLDITTPLEIPDSLPKASSQEAADLRALAKQKFPLLEYAVHSLMYHADMAEDSGISQLHFLDDFPHPQWIKLDKLLEKHEARRHSERVSCLYLTAELNLFNLAKVIHPTVDQCMEVGDERYGCPVVAAAATGSQQVLELFLELFKPDQSTERPSPAKERVEPLYESAQHTPKRRFSFSRKKGLLWSAAELGLDAVVAYLMNSGSYEINSKKRSDSYVLCWAIENKFESVVRILLSKNSDIVNDNVSTNNIITDNKTPLFIAVNSGNHAMIEIILENTTSYNVQFRNGEALCTASFEGHNRIVELLLNKGVDPNTFAGGLQDTPLHAASARGFGEIVEMLLNKGADPNTVAGFEQNTPLHAASARGFGRIVETLLNKGADPSVRSRDHDDALYAASKNGHDEIVKSLLDSGADPNAQGGSYGSALQAASYSGCLEIVKLLLDKGAYPNVLGGHHGSALQAASYSGCLEIVKLLLDKGADPNIQGGYYGNALQAASYKGHGSTVKLLLDKGADPNAQGGKHKSALNAASVGQHIPDYEMTSGGAYKEIMDMLLERGAKPLEDGTDVRPDD